MATLLFIRKLFSTMVFSLMTADDQAVITAEFCYDPQAEHRISNQKGSWPQLYHTLVLWPRSSHRCRLHGREAWGSGQVYSTCCLLASHTGWLQDWDTGSTWKPRSMTRCPRRLTLNFTRSAVLTKSSWWLPNAYCCYFCNPVSMGKRRYDK